MNHYSIRVDMDEILSWIGVKTTNTQISAAAGKKVQHRDTMDISSTAEHTASEELHDKENGLDPNLIEQIQKAARQIESDSAARYTYALFDIEKNRDGQGEQDGMNGDSDHRIKLKGSSLVLTGCDISDLLRECERCILLAVTIGSKVDRTLRKAQISNMSDALILDFCASSAVENLCNQINSDLEDEFESKGFFLTDRFSPGYGDLPIELQRDICRVLQTDKRLGLMANESNMLIPSKSITAVIGISHDPQPKKISGCANCKMRDTCILRKADRTCE